MKLASTVLLIGSACIFAGCAGEVNARRTDSVPPAAIERYAPMIERAGHFSATVSATIGKDGKVISATLVSSNDPQFGEAATAALKRWSFTPARKDGVPVEAKLLMPFHLDR